MKHLIALLAGTLFGLGLSLSGMTDPQIVIGFLDIGGEWNPSLLLVMSAGLAISIPSFYFAQKRQNPILAASFYMPSKTQIDWPLTLGAMVFGIGWGLYGFCPGPAIASLAYVNADSLLFVASMSAGMGLSYLLKKQLAI